MFTGIQVELWREGDSEDADLGTIFKEMTGYWNSIFPWTTVASPAILAFHIFFFLDPFSCLLLLQLLSRFSHI